jgi:hypothetical protein
VLRKTLESKKNAGELRVEFWWGKPDGERSHGKSRRRWEENILMNIKKIIWNSVDWIELALDAEIL